MSDRDKPGYNPDSSGDLDDYWSSSASYHEAKQARETESEANMGPISFKEEWLVALSKALAEDDDHIVTRLREIANDWSHDEKARSYMLKILDNISNLKTHW